MKLFLKSASSGLYHHNYRPNTVASIDFDELLVSRRIEVNPSDNFTSIKGGGLLRMAAQVFPPYGKLYFKTAAFFVPEHQIFSQSEAFHNNQPVYKGRSVVLPHIGLYECMNEWLYSFSTQVLSLNNSAPGVNPEDNYPDPDDYDFIYVENGGAPDVVIYKFRKLNEEGRKRYKFMKMLGFDFPTPTFHFYDTVPSGYTDRYAWIRSTTNQQKNALTLLSFAKIFADYFISGQHFNGSNLSLFLQSVHDKSDCVISGYTMYNSSTGAISGEGVKLIYGHCSKTPVIQDMYTSAWNSPNSPLGVSPVNFGALNNGSLISPYLSLGTRDNDLISESAVGVYSSSHTNGDLAYITTFGERLREAAFRFIMRNNLVGTRPAQRIMARFGIKPSDYTSHYCTKLFESTEEIDFHPVLSNADTVNSGNGLGLGDFAGFGQSGISVNFGYKSSDYGQIFIVHWLAIKPMFIHGCDPSVIRLNPFDWYTPEYDGEALRAIPLMELSVQKDKRTQSEITANPLSDTQIYGFTNIYDEYRFMRDEVLGDFVTGFAKDFLFARDYSLFRNFGIFTLKPQADDVQYSTGGGFTNPFQMSAEDGNRFWFNIQFDIDAERPVKSESDALMLNGSGNIEQPKNGTYSN